MKRIRHLLWYYTHWFSVQREIRVQLCHAEWWVEAMAAVADSAITAYIRDEMDGKPVIPLTAADLLRVAPNFGVQDLTEEEARQQLVRRLMFRGHYDLATAVPSIQED